MAQGLFTLRQVNQAIRQGAWSGVTSSTYSASFNTTATLQYLTTVLSSALSGQFTVEFWYKRYSSGNTTLITIGDSSLTTGIEFYIGTGGSNNTLYSNNAVQISSTAFPFGTWNHIAFTRDGSNVIRLFINGNVVGSTYTSSATFSSSVRIGVEYYASTVSAVGSASISNVRILNGTCLYTTNFAVPTSPLTNITNTALLTLQNATIVDNSSSALSITNTGTVATVVDSGMFSPNIKTSAVEYLVVSGGGAGGGQAGSGGGAGGLLTGILNVATGSSITATVGAGGAGSTGAGGTGVNSVFGSISSSGGGGGNSYGSGPLAANGGSGAGGNLTSSDGVGIGGQGIAGQGNKGGTSGTRVSQACGAGGGGAGTVGLDTVPASNVCGNGGAGIASAINGTVTTYAGGGGGGATSGSTAGTGGVGGGGAGQSSNSGVAGVAGTANTGGGGGAGSFGAGAGGAGGSGIVIVSYPDVYAGATATTGSPTVSTSGSGSVSFSGSSQYLVSGTSSNFSLGTSDFSVECWVYKTSTTGDQVAIGSSVTGNLDPLFFYFGGGGNAAVLYLSSNGTTFDIASAVAVGTVSLNTWAHLAVTRVGTTFKTYLNGVQTSTFTSSASIYKSVNTFAIAAGQTSINGFKGYISNVRVLKGSSAYSSAFTPSTTPLTPITNTVLLVNTVSGAPFADSSTTSTTFTATGSPPWDQLSPFATGLGYKNRVYTWTSSGSITF